VRAAIRFFNDGLRNPYLILPNRDYQV